MTFNKMQFALNGMYAVARSFLAPSRNISGVASAYKIKRSDRSSAVHISQTYNRENGWRGDQCDTVGVHTFCSNRNRATHKANLRRKYNTPNVLLRPTWRNSLATEHYRAVKKKSYKKLERIRSTKFLCSHLQVTIPCVSIVPYAKMKRRHVC